MTNTKEKQYPLEFKQSAVRLAIDSKNKVVQTAQELGVNVKTLHTWIRQYTKPKETIVREMDYNVDEVRRLKQELVRVTQERDLLKKAAAYFAKESK